MSTHNLKCCPFCGGEAAIERVGDARQSTIYSCTDCGCRLETGETFNHGAAWNRRASPPAAESGDAIYANLLAVITDIRRKTGVGIKPMLSELADAIAAKIKAASPPAAVPDGWVMVPREPTEKMHDAARDWSAEKYGKPIGLDASDGCYRAMISAAPAAPNGWRSVRDDPPPKDGRWILATNIGWHGDCEVLGWHFGAWRRSPNTDSDDFTITHWQPIPAAPTEGSDA